MTLEHVALSKDGTSILINLRLTQQAYSGFVYMELFFELDGSYCLEENSRRNPGKWLKRLRAIQ